MAVFMDLAVGYLSASLRILTPIGLAAVGELIVERSGILNLSVEGIMLMGAFVGFITTFYTGNPLLGLFAAGAVGLVLALVFGLLTVSAGLDQVLMGIALNLFVLGTTFFLYRAVFGWYVSPIPPHVKTLIEPIAIPVLSSIPVIGPILFNQLALTYVLIALIPVTAYVLNSTKIGLHLRACGENPQVADYMGINVYLYRYAALAFEGVLAGIAGSLYTISLYDMFLDNITAGRGFVAVAMVILGQWSPWKTLFATFFYSMVEALQLRIQALGLISAWFPYQFALMLPYLTTIVALAVFGRRVKGPEWLAKTFRRLR